MNINEPVSNPKLVDAMEGLSNNNAAQRKFFEEFAQARLLCPADIQLRNSSGDGNEIVVGEGSSISIKHLEDTKGNKFLIAFTDWHELYKWNSSKEQQTVIFGYKDFQSIMKESGDVYAGMVINPFGANIVITLPMLDGMENNCVIEKDEQVLIGIPAEYPTELINELCLYFDREKSVDKAYLLWMVRGEEGSYLLILDSKEEPDTLFPRVGKFCTGILRDKMVDMVSANSDFGKNAVRGHKPFYEKD